MSGPWSVVILVFIYFSHLRMQTIVMSFLPQADGPLRSLVLCAMLSQLSGAHKTFSSSQISLGCRKLCWGCLGSVCLNIASFFWPDGQEFMYSGISPCTGNMGFFYLEYSPSMELCSFDSESQGLIRTRCLLWSL